MFAERIEQGFVTLRKTGPRAITALVVAVAAKEAIDFYSRQTVQAGPPDCTNTPAAIGKPPECSSDRIGDLRVTDIPRLRELLDSLDKPRKEATPAPVQSPTPQTPLSCPPPGSNEVCMSAKSFNNLKDQAVEEALGKERGKIATEEKQKARDEVKDILEAAKQAQADARQQEADARAAIAAAAAKVPGTSPATPGKADGFNWEDLALAGAGGTLFGGLVATIIANGRRIRIFFARRRRRQTMPAVPVVPVTPGTTTIPVGGGATINITINTQP